MTVPSNNLTTHSPFSSNFGAMTVTHHTLPNRVSARLAVLPFEGYGAVHAAPVNLTVHSEPGFILAVIKSLSQQVNQLFSKRRDPRKSLKKGAKLFLFA